MTAALQLLWKGTLGGDHDGAGGGATAGAVCRSGCGADEADGGRPNWEGEGGRSYHHTAPINALYGLHESLIILKEEGIENSWKRHMDNHLLLRKGLEELNISFLVKEEDRLPQLNAIYIPEGINDLETRQKLLNNFNLEIGAGLGVLAGKVWRIGLMGHSSKKENIDHCLNSLAQVI